MIENEKIIKVTNRSTGKVGYDVPDLRISRIYEPKETKEVTMEELRKLSYTIGGAALLRDYLIVKDEEAAKELISDIEPEYYYEEEDVKNLLLNGSLDELLDCLDYAPEGTLSLIKKVAVEIELNDVQKRQAILNALGFNVTHAIENSKLDEEELAEQQETKTRRVATNATGATTGRRVTPTTTKSRYTVINTK